MPTHREPLTRSSEPCQSEGQSCQATLAHRSRRIQDRSAGRKDSLGLPCPRPGWSEPTARPAICLDARAGRVPPPAPGPFRSRSSPRIRPARCRLIRVRWMRASRRSAPHRLWLRSGLADTSCHSGTKGPVDSRPLPVAPLHVGSPWRSATECLGASSVGFDMARCRHYPSRTGDCAYRRGLGGLDETIRRPTMLSAAYEVSASSSPSSS